MRITRPRPGQPTSKVLEGVLETPRPRRGCPVHGEASPPSETVFSPVPRLGTVPEAHRKTRRRCDATFILISNDETRSAEELFRAYRGQSTIGAAFRWLKAPVHASPAFLETPARIEAFGTVMMMA